MLGVCYWWFVQRVEVDAGEVLVLVRKVGQSLPAEAEGQVPPTIAGQFLEPAAAAYEEGVAGE